MSSFECPAADITKLVNAWQKFERGEQHPGKVLANFETAGLPEVLAELIDSGWSHSRLSI